MPKRITPLTPSQVQNAKARSEPYKLRDGGGLFLGSSQISGEPFTAAGTLEA